MMKNSMREFISINTCQWSRMISVNIVTLEDLKLNHFNTRIEWKRKH